MDTMPQRPRPSYASIDRCPCIEPQWSNSFESPACYLRETPVEDFHVQRKGVSANYNGRKSRTRLTAHCIIFNSLHSQSRWPSANCPGGEFSRESVGVSQFRAREDDDTPAD